MSLSSLVTALKAKAVDFLKHEPVAVWGVGAALALNVAAVVFHLDTTWVRTVSTGLALVGILALGLHAPPYGGGLQGRRERKDAPFGQHDHIRPVLGHAAPS